MRAKAKAIKNPAAGDQRRGASGRTIMVHAANEKRVYFQTGLSGTLTTIGVGFSVHRPVFERDVANAEFLGGIDD